jgi:response regulator RpfG family c-di-GMP phosphodiesterase/DNA-binding CsgD family transcriptional regulator
VRLAELCAATSLFTDLGTGQPAEHGLRTCLVAMRLAEALGLAADVRGDVFYVSLLRFLGCTADAHELAGLAGGDEVRFLAGMAPVAMGSPREEMARMISLVAAGQRLPQRLRALARALTDSKGGERLLEAHCEVGTRLATEMGLPQRVAAALGFAYARWDGRGVPAGVAGEDIPVSVRVSIVARDLELWARETSNEAARQVLERRRGHAYDPEVVDAALKIGAERLRHCQDDLWEVVLTMEPWPQMVVSGPELLRTLGALGDYADLKIPERSGYARRVTRVVAAAAEIADLDAPDTTTLIRAALVHDLGVVAVPVKVWRARPQPGSANWEQVRLHPHWSARVLARCSGLEQVAVVAGQHHERLDGGGYPSGLAGDLGRASGLLACAVLFDELTSARPSAGTNHSATDVAADMADLASRGSVGLGDVNAVLGAVGIAAPRVVAVKRPASLTEREVDVLCLLARGETNRQIANTLGISVKTVGAHVEHIYTKADVRSRAAATLFAMQHDLVG